MIEKCPYETSSAAKNHRTLGLKTKGLQTDVITLNSILYKLKCRVSTSVETWKVFVEKMCSYNISVRIINLLFLLSLWNPTVYFFHEEINEIDHRALVQLLTTHEIRTFFFSYRRFSTLAYLSCGPCSWQVSELMLLAGDQWSSLVSCVLGSCFYFVFPLSDLSDAAITSFLSLSSIMDDLQPVEINTQSIMNNPGQLLYWTLFFFKKK